jgi:hypothetical protein
MEVWVSKGFLIFAQNTDVDYVRQAYALALSIKYSQEINNVSIVTNDIIPDDYKLVFDQIIPIPWFIEEPSSLLKTENRWKMYHASPYDETIVLDSDMLLLEDISLWWDYCSDYNIKFCSRIKNYKLEVVKDLVYRKAFISNKLSSPYYALHYFKKSNEASEFYRVLEFVCNNWELCWSKFAPNEYQNWPSMDLATAIAIEICMNYSSVDDQNSPLELIHMKPLLQGWNEPVEHWHNVLSYVLNSQGKLIVGNIKQDKLFHYVEKDFIDDTMLLRLKELVYGTKN